MAKNEKPNAQTKLDDGFEELGGKFAPFAILDEGDQVQGVIEAVRESERQKKNKKGRVLATDYQIMLDVRLTQPCTAWNKSEKNGGKRTEHAVGDIVCFPSKTMVDNRLTEIVKEKTGAVLGEEADVRADFLQPVVGEEIRVSREAGQEIKKGEWAGKIAHQYRVGWKKNKAAAAA